MHLNTHESIEKWIVSIVNESIRSSGLAHDLYVKNFPTEFDSRINEVAPAFREYAFRLAEDEGYAPPSEIVEMQAEIEAADLCPHTGLNADCCPCYYHE